MALAGTAYGLAEVGGSPTRDYGFCSKFVRPCSRAIVVGTARYFDGPLEVIAFDSKGGLCRGFDHLKNPVTFIFCGAPAPPHGSPISFETYGGSTDGDGVTVSTTISGLLKAKATSVRVRFRRRGTVERRAATVATVAGKLLKKVKQPRPFGIFELTVRGCAPAAFIKTRAFDSAGRLVGKAPSPFPGKSCEQPGGGRSLRGSSAAAVSASGDRVFRRIH